MTPDPTFGRIAEAVRQHHGHGDREAARRLFAGIWTDIGGERGNPLHVCVLAHSMADVQDDVREELRWDQRALAAAGRITDEQVAAAGVPLSAVGLYPSLHLNLADCHRRLGDTTRAREHLEYARAGMAALDDDDYGRLIRSGLHRLEDQLTEQE